jgi:hypothetical protein
MPTNDDISERIREAIIAYEDYRAKSVLKPPEPRHPSFNDLSRWMVTLLFVFNGPLIHRLARRTLVRKYMKRDIEMIRKYGELVHPYHFIEVLMGANHKEKDAVISEALIAMETDVMEYIHDHPGD